MTFAARGAGWTASQRHYFITEYLTYDEALRDLVRLQTKLNEGR